MLQKTAKKAIKRLPSVTLIISFPTATQTQTQELHSNSLKDIKNSTDFIIGELLANATSASFSLVFVGNVTLL